MLIKRGVFLNNNYKNFNKTILVLCVSFVLIPTLAFFMKKYFYDIYAVIKCPYYFKTGAPCPFCGITTDLKNMLLGNIQCTRYNLLSIPIMITLILEVLFRIVLIKNNIDIKSNKIFLIDLIVHSVLIILLIIYVILFFYLNLARF